MRKLKQATQREKARRALKDRKAAEPSAAPAKPHGSEQRPILYKGAAPAGTGGEQGRRTAPSPKVTHH